MPIRTALFRLFPNGFIRPCLPRPSAVPMTGSEWLHEIKHDGFRLLARRKGERIRLFTRRGYDWTDRYPRIVHAMEGLKVQSAFVDGEAVLCRPDGVSDFDGLMGRTQDRKVFLYAFDLLELNGEDLRSLPLEERKARLAKLINDTNDGIEVAELLEGDGRVIFEHTCALGLEGIVSKRRNSPYVSGRSRSWIKVRNPDSAAMKRYEEGTW
jgi:bifunctional non-homologous end joining protein LigD